MTGNTFNAAAQLVFQNYYAVKLISWKHFNPRRQKSCESSFTGKMKNYCPAGELKGNITDIKMRFHILERRNIT